MAYFTSIIKEFKTEFPNANLIVAYDIACRMQAPKYMLGLGLEDGENAERFWSLLPSMERKHGVHEA